MKWSFNRSKKKSLTVDMHSHLIPGIDDGAMDLNHSIKMITLLQSLGFKKIITTPHIHPKYPNSENSIMDGLQNLVSNLSDHGLNEVQVEAAAEYYIDDHFMDQLKGGKNDYLTVGNVFILIECSFSVKPYFFDSVIYQLKEKGYRPILAHPERYRFLESEIDWLYELRAAGVLFQVNLGSLGGMYGDLPKKIGLKLIKNKMVDFLASDLHRTKHISFLKKGLALREVQKLIKSNTLINEELL